MSLDFCFRAALDLRLSNYFEKYFKPPMDKAAQVFKRYHGIATLTVFWFVVSNINIVTITLISSNIILKKLHDDAT